MPAVPDRAGPQAAPCTLFLRVKTANILDMGSKTDDDRVTVKVPTVRVYQVNYSSCGEPGQTVVGTDVVGLDPERT